MNQFKKICQGGFTVTELAVSITLAGFLAAVIFTATLYYYANVLQAEATTELGLDSQTILTQLTDDIRLADAIATTNSISDPHAPSGGWTTGNPSNVLIIESPVTDSARNIIFDSSTTLPYRNEFIYFQSGTTMYKRILANTSASGNTAITTCPSQYATSSCPIDRQLSQYVSNLSFTFYDSSNNTTADATAARSVSLRVDMTKKVFGKTISLSNTTRVTLRNQ